VSKSAQGLAAASDVAKQIITLSTGVVTVTVAFFEKIEGSSPSPLAHGLIVASWILFILTILAAVVTLMGVTTRLDVVDQTDNGEKDPRRPAPSAYDNPVRGPAAAMVVLFVFAMGLTAAAGVFRAPPVSSPASAAPPTVKVICPAPPLPTPPPARDERR